MTPVKVIGRAILFWLEILFWLVLIVSGAPARLLGGILRGGPRPRLVEPAGHEQLDARRRER